MNIFWAKWSGGFYPLAAHLIDTAAFADVLCHTWLPGPLVDRAAALCGASSDHILKVVRTAAALHDLGKATATFQGQLDAAQRPTGLDRHVDRIRTEHSLPFQRHGLSGDHRRWLRRHEVAGAALLRGRLNLAGSEGVASLVAGHHGVWDVPMLFDDPWPNRRCHDHLFDSDWERARKPLLDTVCAVTDSDPDLAEVDPVVMPLLTAVVIVADWLASDLASHDRSWPEDDDWEAHHRRRLPQAERSVAELLGTASRPGSFSQVFPFAPNTLQRSLLDDRSRGGLRIVAVPTGAGKTEAALGRWLHTAADRQGLYFALPTMATADAMMRRVRQMFEGTAAVGALAHGQALLNDFYDDAPRRVNAETHDGHDGLAPSRWLSGSRRAVLAPVTVGTADQLVLAVASHRYNVLRLLGAATKTVVFDEVHSYDPYMSSLLERFLVWAGLWQVDVVLLSATLPRERLAAYVRAYGGRPAPEAGYPAVTTVSVQGGTHTAALPPHPSRTLQLVHHLTGDQAGTTADLVRRLREQHPRAKIGVIVNTVARCQEIAAELAGRRGPDGQPAGRAAGQLQVMHARFTAGDRAEQTDRAVATFGKASTGGPATMVATQVVEQSLDLDFDVLVTDLCPAPSLVQRAGRLHRHDLTGRRRDRPDGCTEPIVHVVVPDAAAGADGAQGWQFLPYPAGGVLRTWTDGLHGGERTSLMIPDDVQDFVDASHITLDELAESTAIGHVQEQLLGRIVQLRAADQEAVPTPEALRHDVAAGLRRWAPHDRSTPPRSRWIDRASYDLLLVADQHTHGSLGAGPWIGPLPTSPDKQQIRQLLRHVVSVPFDPTGAPADGPADDLPAGWAGTHLERLHIVDLDAADMTYDSFLGLVRTPR